MRKTGGLEVWVKKMNGGSRAVGLLNRTESEAEITAQWADLGLSEQTQAAVRDLWAHETVSTRQGNYSAKVASHGTVVIKLCLQSR